MPSDKIWSGIDIDRSIWIWVIVECIWKTDYSSRDHGGLCQSLADWPNIKIRLEFKIKEDGDSERQNYNMQVAI